MAKKILVLILFGPKNFWVDKDIGQKDFGSKKILGPIRSLILKDLVKKCLIVKKFGRNKILLDIFFLKKLRQQNLVKLGQ